MEYAPMNPAMAGHLSFQPFGGVLPPGWLEYRTPTGQPYWYNTFTRQSSWQFPAIIPPQPPKKKKQIKKKIPDTHWLFVLTPDGYEFYYDRETKTSVWEMPEELKEPMEKLKELEKQQKQKEEEEHRKKRALEEEEAKERVKKFKLEQEQELEKQKEKEQLNEQLNEQEQEQVQGQEQEQEKEPEQEQVQEQAQEDVEATEMTEDDIMWQLQQMEEMSGEPLDEHMTEPMDEEDQQAIMAIQEQDQEGEEGTEEKEKKAAVAAEEEEAAAKEPELTEQECIDQFNEMLREKDISPFATYSTELPKLMTDPRFTMVKHNKQKALFNKYCKDLGEKIRQEKMNKKTPQEEFQELLESKVTVKMYWDDFRRKYKNDGRFQALKSTKEKEALFKEHVKHHLGNKKKASPTDDYMTLLRETKEIKQGMRWRDAKRLLEKDDRYYAIDSKEKREDLFRDYLDSL